MKASVGLWCIAAAVMVSACAGKPPVVVECTGGNRGNASDGPALVGQNYGARMSTIPLDAVQYTDKRIARRVAVQSMYAQQTQTRNVAVGARFVNCSTASVALGVRTSFLDATLRPTEAASAWKTVYVPAKSTATYDEISVDRDRVKHYLIEVRDGNQAQ